MVRPEAQTDKIRAEITATQEITVNQIWLEATVALEMILARTETCNSIMVKLSRQATFRVIIRMP